MTDKAKSGGNISSLERHGQTIIAGLILASIIWVGNSVAALSGTMGVVINRLQNLELSIAAMDERFDRYQTKAQAVSEMENIRLVNKILDRRIESIEQKVGR